MQGRWDLGIQHIEEIVLSPLCSNGYHSVAAHADNYPGGEAIGARFIWQDFCSETPSKPITRIHVQILPAVQIRSAFVSSAYQQSKQHSISHPAPPKFLYPHFLKSGMVGAAATVTCCTTCYRCSAPGGPLFGYAANGVAPPSSSSHLLAYGIYRYCFWKSCTLYQSLVSIVGFAG